MVRCEDLCQIMKKNGLVFFSGVPDSTFKDWTRFLDEKNGTGLTNIIASNECEAIAVASGYNLATGKIGTVYMQNSGEGNTVNPLTSLCDPEVFSIGLLLMIGWRGEPGKKDEPQHKKMGRITLPLLDVLEVPYNELPKEKENVEIIISEAVSYIKKNNSSYALIIKYGTVEKYESCQTEQKREFEMSREEAIKTIVDSLNGSEAIISTTGKTSRELFEYRAYKSEEQRDFYNVGSMGCVAPVALGISLQKPDKKIVILDGDGSVIMQMGTLATIGHYKPKNLCHVILDNGSYESTGGQPTVSDSIDFKKIALACGYASAKIITSKPSLVKEVKKIEKSKGPSMLIVKINKRSRKDLGRPTITPVENKEIFMRWIR